MEMKIKYTQNGDTEDNSDGFKNPSLLFLGLNEKKSIFKRKGVSYV